MAKLFKNLDSLADGKNSELCFKLIMCECTSI